MQRVTSLETLNHTQQQKKNRDTWWAQKSVRQLQMLNNRYIASSSSRGAFIIESRRREYSCLYGCFPIGREWVGHLRIVYRIFQIPVEYSIRRAAMMLLRNIERGGRCVAHFKVCPICYVILDERTFYRGGYMDIPHAFKYHLQYIIYIISNGDYIYIYILLFRSHWMRAMMDWMIWKWSIYRELNRTSRNIWMLRTISELFPRDRLINVIDGRCN